MLRNPTPLLHNLYNVFVPPLYGTAKFAAKRTSARLLLSAYTSHSSRKYLPRVQRFKTILCPVKNSWVKRLASCALALLVSSLLFSSGVSIPRTRTDTLLQKSLYEHAK